ncbi:MAG: ABC transporter ATP-binding protein [Actinomycetes bacterium]
MKPPEDPIAASTLTGTSLPIAGEATLKRYVRALLHRHRRTFALVISLHSVSSIAALVGPVVLGALVEELSGGSASISIDAAAILFLTALLIQTVFTRITRLRAGILGEEVLADLREDFLKRAVSLPTGVIERAGTGDLVSRVTTDIDRLTHAVRDAVPEITISLVSAVFVGGALIVTAPELALTWLLAVPPILISSRWYFKRAPQSYRAESATYAAVSSSVAETVDAGQTIELYQLAQSRINVTNARIKRWVSWERYTLWLRCWWFPAIEAGYVLPVVGVLAWGSWLVARDDISLGQLTTGLLLTQMLIEPVDLVLMWYDELQVGQASLARLVGVQEVPDPITDPDLRPTDDRLIVEGVRFGYRSGRDVLHGIDLDVAPGERLALVGPSGAGKSTLGRLMAGIYAPRTGSITMGGAELAQMPAEQVRTQVALVNQEHHVFVGTLRDNLLLARPDADDTRLLAALDSVDATPWVETLSDGLDTVVGSGGHGLAPGQSQQLALARLILADPHTLVLDEATSLLDPRAARHLERSLNAVLKGRTVIAIAHRLHTAYDADRIAVIDGGRITELGSHDELVAANGPYAALWRSWRDAD